ncbi:protein Flattop-like [Physella acuta]|uniref:protein Flattop-like n=1 Tax=Physella acuta TaxID=109671 RepID=UPI0027DB56D4|nr:protein Flattop-like [Physella acuta]
MSINFHANQYEQAFTSHRIQNWEVPQIPEGKHPKANTGFTRVIANDRGHLLTNIAKERKSPWGTFVGTWDMPHKIPGNRITVPTARTDEALLKGQKLKETGDEVLSGALKPCHTVEPLPVKLDAPEDQRPAGITCVPASGARGSPTCVEPCSHVERTHYDDNQPRAISRKESRETLKWPRARSPQCKSPAALTSYDINQMHVDDVNVVRQQRDYC